MELAQILKSLNRNKLLVAGAAVLALVAAIITSGRGETVRGGTASAEVLVDARESALGDLRRDTVPLVARSNIFARFLGAGGATAEVAREAGIPKGEISVVGPPLNIDGVPDQAAAEQATEQVEGAPYLVQVQQGDDLPLLTIFSKAPSEDEARRLADGAVAALTDFVAQYQQETEIPPRRRVTIRALGATRVAAFEETPSAILPVLSFLAVLFLSCVGILARSSARSGDRSPRSGGGLSPTTNGNGNGGATQRPARTAKQFLRRTHSAIRSVTTSKSRDTGASAKTATSAKPTRSANGAKGVKVGTAGIKADRPEGDRSPKAQRNHHRHRNG